MPAETPVTNPVVPTVATDVLLLDQVPPAVALDKAMAEPVHTLVAPVIEPAEGNGLIVTMDVA